MLTDRKIPNALKEKIRIMVVEDNLLNQKLAGFMIKSWGLQYDIAPNGKRAIELLKLFKYDLIIMDIHMPVMDGYETTKYIRSELKLGLPIIATTSIATEEERAKCLSSGMTDYLPKPIKEEDMYNMVTNYLFATVVENVDNPLRNSNRLAL
jgi:CheY-like chemotaxis protein